jgi:hypothetical protein
VFDLRPVLRLLHYWWPLALGWSLTVVVQRATGQTPDAAGLTVLLAGIAAAYSLDRVMDPSLTGSRWTERILTAAGIAASLICVAAALRLPLRTALLVPLLGLSSVAYPQLKRLPFIKTVVLPVIWLWASLALPFDHGSWFGWRALASPVTVPLLLLVASGCLLCDLKDEHADRSAGVPSLPALFGAAVTLAVAVGLAAAAAGLALLEHRTGIVVSAAVLSATTAAPAVLVADATGPLLVDVILTLPGILISARLV